MSDRFWYVLLLPVIILDIAAIADIVVRRDFSIGKKVVWTLVVLLLPAFGAVIYLFARYKVFKTIRQAMR
jgi:hypothetical protein